MLMLRAKGWRDASTETPRHGAYLPEGIWSVAPLFLEKNNKQQDHHLPRTLSSAPGSVIIGVPLYRPFGTLAPGDAPGLGIRPSSPGLSLSPPRIPSRSETVRRLSRTCPPPSGHWARCCPPPSRVLTLEGGGGQHRRAFIQAWLVLAAALPSLASLTSLTMWNCASAGCITIMPRRLTLAPRPC